ncbi:Peroxisome biogenesis protein 1 [Diplonema papillatum]|nr:Peroxisome biogenesis protein 1 [Diplonema papillatum]
MEPRQATCTVLPLFGTTDCFVTLPSALVERAGVVDELTGGGPRVVVVEIETEAKVKHYASWSYSTTGDSSSIGIPTPLMKQFGLSQGDGVAVRILARCPVAKQVHVAPASVDDSEIVEHNAELLEDLILRQLRVAYVGLLCPIHVRRGVHVHMKVESLVPQPPPGAPNVVTLGEGTELIVATKTRDKQSAPAGTQQPRPALLRIVGSLPPGGAEPPAAHRFAAAADTFERNGWPTSNTTTSTATAAAFSAACSRVADLADAAWDAKGAEQHGEGDAGAPDRRRCFRGEFAVVQGYLADRSPAAQLQCGDALADARMLAPRGRLRVGDRIAVLPGNPDTGTHHELFQPAPAAPRNRGAALRAGNPAAWDVLSRHAACWLAPGAAGDRVALEGGGVRCHPLLVTGSKGAGKSVLVEGLRRAAEEELKVPVVSYSDALAAAAAGGGGGGGEKADPLATFQRCCFSARVQAPCLFLIDDLHRVTAGAAGSAKAQAATTNALVSTLLEAVNEPATFPTLFDAPGGGAARQGPGRVVIVATCAALEKLDKTVSQVFTRRVAVGMPGADEKKCIFEAGCREAACGVGRAALQEVARRTNNYSRKDAARLADRAVHQAVVAHGHSAHRSPPAHPGLDAAEAPAAELAAPPLEVTTEHVAAALAGFVPSSMEGVTLHQKMGADVDHPLSWKDAGGLAEAKRAFEENVILPAKYPEIYKSVPVKLRSGMLLYGPTGCGKTHVVDCAVAEAGLPCIRVSGPEMLNKYIGQSEQRVREVFEQARAAAPCLLFFDEFDSIAPQRGHDNTGVTDRVVNQLLCHLDGAEGREGVFVVAATARPDLLDKALLRPGRLDLSIYCPMPERSERAEILQACARHLRVDSAADWGELASRTEGYSGADLSAVLSTARLQSIQTVVDTASQFAAMNIADEDPAAPAAGSWFATHGQTDDFESVIADLGIAAAAGGDAGAGARGAPPAEAPEITQDGLLRALDATPRSISAGDAEKNRRRYAMYKDARAEKAEPNGKAQRVTLA